MSLCIAGLGSSQVTPLDIHQFWGKAQPHQGKGRAQWHPLTHHSLDVAAVGEALLMRTGLPSQELGPSPRVASRDHGPDRLLSVGDARHR